jgi:alkaline phosphatase
VLDTFMAIVDFMNGKSAQPWWKYTAQRKREVARREKNDVASTKKSPTKKPPTKELSTKKSSTTESSTAGRVGRREFLEGGALLLCTGLGLTANRAEAFLNDDEPVLRIGLLTDLHYADRAPNGTRHYRETPRKVVAAAKQLRQPSVELVFELGDLIDSADTLERELEYARTIHKQLQELPGRKHYVLGNHCVSRLTKEEFLAAVQQESAHYSFDAGSFHFVVLDACYRNDGEPYGRENFVWTDANIPAQQLTWLQDDLARTKLPTLVFVHQRLDVSDDYGIKNAPAVRDVLEKSRNVLAVMQGHNHKNDYRDIGGIHYVSLQAMVEGNQTTDNAFACAELYADRRIKLTGFANQKSYSFPV